MTASRKGCQVPSHPNALRYILLIGLLAAKVVFAQSSDASLSCIPHNHNSNGGSGDGNNDIDEDGEDGGHFSFSTWSLSGCAGPTGTWSWTRTSAGASTTSAGASSGNPNLNLSANGNGLSKGSIAGIVIGLVAAIVIALLVLFCIRRRCRARRKLARKGTFIGPAIATSMHAAAGTKEAVQLSQGQGQSQNRGMAMANVAPSHPPGLHHRLSGDTLLQILCNTPAYTSTDNLSSLSYLQSHPSQMRRASTAVSFSSPSEATTGVTVATVGHGSSNSNGHRGASFYDNVAARQKELENTYSEKELSSTASSITSPSSPTSPSDHSIIRTNLPEHPPPRYPD